MKRYILLLTLSLQACASGEDIVNKSSSDSASSWHRYALYATPASYILGGSFILGIAIHKVISWLEHYHFMVRIQNRIAEAQALITRVTKEHTLILDGDYDILSLYGAEGLAAQALKECIKYNRSFLEYQRHLIETLERVNSSSSLMQSTLESLEGYPSFESLKQDAITTYNQLIRLQQRLTTVVETLSYEHGYNTLLQVNEHATTAPYAPVISLYNNYTSGAISFEEYSATSTEILTKWVSPQASPFALALAAGELQKQLQVINNALYQLRTQTNYGSLTNHYRAEEQGRYIAEALEFLLSCIMRSSEYAQQKKALHQARLEQEKLDIERSKIRLQEEQLNELRVQTDEIRRQNALLEEKNRIALAKLSYDEEAKKLINSLEREIKNYRHKLQELEKALRTEQQANTFLEDRHDDATSRLEEITIKLRTLIYALNSIKEQLQYPPHAPYTQEYVQWIEQSIIPRILAL